MIKKLFFLLFLICLTSYASTFVNQRCVKGDRIEYVRVTGTHRCSLIVERRIVNRLEKITTKKYISNNLIDCNKPAEEEIRNLYSQGYTCANEDETFSSYAPPIPTPIIVPDEIEIPTPVLTPNPFPIPSLKFPESRICPWGFCWELYNQ